MATGWDIAAPPPLRPIYVTRSEAVRINQEVAWDGYEDHLIISHQSLVGLSEENADLRKALGRPLPWPA